MHKVHENPAVRIQRSADILGHWSRAGGRHEATAGYESYKPLLKGPMMSRHVHPATLINQDTKSSHGTSQSTGGAHARRWGALSTTALLDERRCTGLSEERGMASLCWKKPQYYYITASRLSAPDCPGWARKHTLQHIMRAG